MTTRRMIIMLLLVAVVFGGIFGMQYMGRQGMAQYFDSMPVPPATISTALAERQTWQNELEAPGSVIARLGTVVTTESAGIVKALHFESGDTVEKGKLLLQLDSANERAELAQLQAQAELTELKRTRQQKLYGLEAISKSDVDTAVSESNASKAAVDAQRAKLALKEIRAPFSGTLGVQQISIGQYLNPGQPIANLHALDPLQVDFDLPEQRVGQVVAGFKVLISTEASADRTFEGTVLAIEPQVDPATRNFKVRAMVPNPDHLLRPGQFARVRLSLPDAREVVVIPRTAIDYSAYGDAVFVVNKKKDAGTQPAAPAMPGAPPSTDLEVTQRFVHLGAARGDFVVVTDGLKAGEQIATTGLLKLRTGQPVIVNNTVTPEATQTPKPEPG
ncbi:MAG: efflux RND transporter periplasmic adaptor subunit [Panacagrimonas sp.]